MEHGTKLGCGQEAVGGDRRRHFQGLQSQLQSLIIHETLDKSLYISMPQFLHPLLSTDHSPYSEGYES